MAGPDQVGRIMKQFNRDSPALDPTLTPRQKLIRQLQEARAANMSTPPQVADPMAAAAQEEQRRQQQQEEEERQRLAAEEAKNV